MGIDSQTGVDEEEELKMKIVLYYHTLVSFQSVMGPSSVAQNLSPKLTSNGFINFSSKAYCPNGSSSCSNKTTKSSPSISIST